MKHRILKKYLWLNALANSSSADKNVGGQAVIEGVMMRSPEKVCTAIRLKSGKIVTKTQKFVSLTRKHKALSKPILRGVVSFFEMLVLGMRSLNFSADVFSRQDENIALLKADERSGRFDIAMALAIFISIGAAIAIFFFLPIFITQLLDIDQRALGFNLVAGAVRVTIFIAYVWVLSFFKDFRRVFEYHGAEHKSIFAFEANLPLNADSTRRFTTYHPRCGTSFILIVAVLAIITYSLSDTLFAIIFSHAPNVIQRFATHLLFLPLVAGISFELLKLSGKTRNNRLTQILIAPGLWIQRITTKEPSDDQIEVAISALKSSIEDTPLAAELIH